MKALVLLRGGKGSYEAVALVDPQLSTTLVDVELADRIGIELTGSRLTVDTFYGRVEAEEGVVEEVVVGGSPIEREVVVVSEIPRRAKELLARNDVDVNVVVGRSTINRAGLILDSASGSLRGVEPIFEQSSAELNRGLSCPLARRGS